MAAEDAIVLHTLDAGSPCAGYSFFVNDAILQPEIRNAKADDVVDDGRNEFRGAEDIDQIDSPARLLARRGVGGIERR